MAERNDRGGASSKQAFLRQVIERAKAELPDRMTVMMRDDDAHAREWIARCVRLFPGDAPVEVVEQIAMGIMRGVHEDWMLVVARFLDDVVQRETSSSDDV